MKNVKIKIGQATICTMACFACTNTYETDNSSEKQNNNSLVFGDLNVYRVDTQRGRAAVSTGTERRKRWRSTMYGRSIAQIRGSGTRESVKKPVRGSASLVSINGVLTASHVVDPHADDAPWRCDDNGLIDGSGTNTNSLYRVGFGEYFPSYEENIFDIDTIYEDEYLLYDRLKKLGLNHMLTQKFIGLHIWNPDKVTNYFTGGCVDDTQGIVHKRRNQLFDDGHPWEDIHRILLQEKMGIDMAYLSIKPKTFQIQNSSGLVLGEFDASPGLFFDWLDVKPTPPPLLDENTLASLKSGAPLYALHAQKDTQNTDENDAISWALIGEPGYLQGDPLGEPVKMNTCKTLFSGPSYAPFCVETTLDSLPGSSGGAVLSFDGIKAYIKGVMSFATISGTGKIWGDGDLKEEYPNQGDAFTSFTPVFFDIVPPPSEPPPPDRAPPKYPVKPPVPGSATCVGDCLDPQKVSELSCPSLYGGAGLGIGLLGGSTSSVHGGQIVGSLGVACQPWVQAPYSSVWANVRQKSLSRAGNIYDLPTKSLLRHAFQESYRQDTSESALLPLPAQLCPPGYGLQGIEITRNNKDELSSVDALYCIPVIDNFAPLVLDRVELRGYQDAFGRSVDQVLGSPSGVSLSVRCGAQEVVSSLWITKASAGSIIDLGLSCVTLEN